MSDTPDIEVIHALPIHHAFIYASWLPCYRRHSRFGRSLEAKTYFKYHHAAIDRILKRPTSIQLVASMRDDEKTIFGYIVAERAERDVVHFAFVKGPFRKMGIAKELWKALGWNLNKCAYTHQLDDMSWINVKFPGFLYIPYLI